MNATTAQKRRTLFYTASNLHLNGLFRESETGGDLLLRHTLEFAKNDNFTATGRQSIDGQEQEFDFLALARLFGNAKAFCKDGQCIQIRYSYRR